MNEQPRRCRNKKPILYLLLLMILMMGVVQLQIYFFFFTLHISIRIHCVCTHLHTLTEANGFVTPRSSIKQTPCFGLTLLWKHLVIYWTALFSCTHAPTSHAMTEEVFLPPLFFRAWWIIHVEADQQQKCWECRFEGKPCGFRDVISFLGACHIIIHCPQTGGSGDLGITVTQLMELLCIAHQRSHAVCWCILGIWLTKGFVSCGLTADKLVVAHRAEGGDRSGNSIFFLLLNVFLVAIICSNLS